MANELVALLIGLLVGLFFRPILDAYLLWRTTELFRPQKHATTDRLEPFDDEVTRSLRNEL